MTVRDAADLDPAMVLEADVVVIGSGPAGLTVAMDLAAQSVRVLVVESGNRSIDAATRDFDEGDVVGHPLRFQEVPFGTADMRLRAVGGASGHWTGMCRPLDEIDLAVRHWIPGSGWPLDRAELDPWYRQAEDTLKLGTTGWDAEAWYRRTGAAPLFESDRMTTTVCQFSPPVSFGSDFGDVLESESGPDVVFGATAVDASLTATGDRLDQIELRRLDGEILRARGAQFVLAVGGLEVPRLLLSWGSGAAGLANGSGQVGLGFMEHPHREMGQVRATFEGDVPALYAWGDAPGAEPPTKVWAGWSPSPEVQEQDRIGHGIALLRFADGRASSAADPSRVTQAMGDLVEWHTSGRAVTATVSVRTEQRPHAASRVTLGPTRDATGLRRIQLDWQPTKDDDHTGRRIVELLAEEFGRAGIGRIEVDPRGAPFAEIPMEIGCHPMGAARMGADPASSVVGADLRTHDITNLFVCSSAVFPTGGHANPTLTIVALAHRLAAHLGR